jgi:hypothetical protein
LSLPGEQLDQRSKRADRAIDPGILGIDQPFVYAGTSRIAVDTKNLACEVAYIDAVAALDRDQISRFIYPVFG